MQKKMGSLKNCCLNKRLFSCILVLNKGKTSLSVLLLHVILGALNYLILLCYMMVYENLLLVKCSKPHVVKWITLRLLRHALVHSLTTCDSLICSAEYCVF